MTQSNILVSTITPCFRMKPYLKLFLDELPKQTIFDSLEVVLDHNQPDEEEVSWVKDFQEKYPGRIKHIITNPVVPIGISMNTCIREASGMYLTVWNVDDLRTPDSIELQVKAMEREQADIVYGDYTIVRKFAPSGTQGGTLISHKEIPASEFTRSMIFGPFFMFRKSICKVAGLFDEQLVSGADFDFSVRLAMNGKAVMTDGLLGYYLNEGKGASTRPGSKQELDRTIIELRYGIYDKVDYDLVAEASTYKLQQILNDGVFCPIEQFAPNYSELIKTRITLWKKKGVQKFILNKFLMTKKIKMNVKRILKPIYLKLKSR